MIVNHYFDILAWNDLAASLWFDFARLAPHERNHLRMLFTEPDLQALYPDWAAAARNDVAALRMHAAENPHAPRLVALVGELSLISPQFRQWWAARHVARPDFGHKTIHHPELGELTLDWDSFQYAGDPGQHLVMWSAQEGSPSETKLRLLGTGKKAESAKDFPGGPASDRG